MFLYIIIMSNKKVILIGSTLNLSYAMMGNITTMSTIFLEFKSTLIEFVLQNKLKMIIHFVYCILCVLYFPACIAYTVHVYYGQCLDYYSIVSRLVR